MNKSVRVVYIIFNSLKHYSIDTIIIYIIIINIYVILNYSLKMIAQGHPTLSTSFGSISDYYISDNSNNKEQTELIEFSSSSTIYVESSFYHPKELYYY
ncbi:hypothetical protein CHM_2g3820 [Cryptosporidium hominis]